jgi:type 1 glutamine amidotransferase
MRTASFRVSPTIAAIAGLFLLAPLGPAQDVDTAAEFPGAAPLTATHPNLPNGFDLLAYLDCGATELADGDNGTRLTRTRGEARAIPDLAASFSGEARDSERVEFSVEGLQTGTDYVLGFTWFDAAAEGRVQSVEFSSGEGWTTVVPAAIPLAFHGDQPTWARVLLPIPSESVKDGAIPVAFSRESGDAVGVNELWLLGRVHSEAQKRVVVVTGDDWTGHLWRATGPEIAAILREDARLEVSITESPFILGSPLLDQYDAVVLHFKNYAERLPLGEAVWSGLERYVQTGHGLVLVHFGCGAFQEWEGYVHLCGRVWDPEKRGHDPYGPFEVRVANATHPITSGMKSFDTADELYTCLVGTPPIEILFDATSKVDGTNHPMGFVVPESGERVFHSTLGHDVPSLQHPGSRELYRRSVAWASGLEP